MISKKSIFGNCYYLFMADTKTKEQRHINMSHIHSASTKPELALRCCLWHKGFRYRVNVKRLPGTPDIVLPKYNTVIFVHGCFWHGHKGCKKYTVPKTNTEFWKEKVARNKERDEDVWRLLEAQGWSIIIVWECELKKDKIQETIDRVEKEILHNSEALKSIKEERKKARLMYHKGRVHKKEQEILFKKELKKRFSKFSSIQEVLPNRPS